MRGLLLIGPLEEAVAPPKRRIAMNLTDLGTVTNAVAFNYLLHVFQPVGLVAQARQRRAGQSIERGLAGRASVTLQSRCRTSACEMVMSALGANRYHHCPVFDQASNRLDMTKIAKALRQKTALVRRQLLKRFDQCMKFVSPHNRPYLYDLYTLSVDH